MESRPPKPLWFNNSDIFVQVVKIHLLIQNEESDTLQVLFYAEKVWVWYVKFSSFSCDIVLIFLQKNMPDCLNVSDSIIRH